MPNSACSAPLTAELSANTNTLPKKGHHNEHWLQPISLAHWQEHPKRFQERQHRWTQNCGFMDSPAGPGGSRNIQ
jgi:hypothetical protein